MLRSDDGRSAVAHLVRETAALLYAADMMWFREHPTAETQLAWCRVSLLEGEGRAHDGDCVRQPQTCMRCLWEVWSEKARRLLDENEEG